MRSASLVTVLSLHDFQFRWSSMHERVFAGRDLVNNPFTEASWRIACICGPLGYVNERPAHLVDLSNPYSRIYAAFMKAIRTTGDVELIGCLLGAPYTNESFFSTTHISPPALLEMRRKAVDVFDLQIFGRSCRWGVALSGDEELSLVAGDAAFMEQFIAEAGGRLALRDAFMDCADYLLEFSPGTARFAEQLMRLAGWSR